MRLCNIEGCNKKHRARGYCSAHWKQWSLGNEPGDRTLKDRNEIIVCGDTAEIVLYGLKRNEQARTIIDTVDIKKIQGHKWRMSKRRVATHGKDGENIFLHRLINGTPDGMDTDHIDRDQLNNRCSNLRTATHSENMQNAIGHRDSVSQLKGVTWQKNCGKWGARIRRTSLGWFETKEAAALAYDNAAREHFGEFARPNFQEAMR